MLTSTIIISIVYLYDYPVYCFAETEIVVKHKRRRVINGSFTVKSALLGNENSDGVLNGKDWTIFFLFLACLVKPVMIIIGKGVLKK